MQFKFKAFCASLAIAGALASGPSLAAQQLEKAVILGTFGDWNAYTYQNGGHAVCFMSSAPTKSEGKYTRRDPVSFFITHWPSDGTRNVASFAAGYGFSDGASVSVTVDGQTFEMFTKGETAWAVDQAVDDKLTAALQKGSRMVVKGTSARGTATTDTFSLKGTADAYRAISKACGM